MLHCLIREHWIAQAIINSILEKSIASMNSGERLVAMVYCLFLPILGTVIIDEPLTCATLEIWHPWGVSHDLPVSSCVNPGFERPNTHGFVLKHENQYIPSASHHISHLGLESRLRFRCPIFTYPKCHYFDPGVAGPHPECFDQKAQTVGCHCWKGSNDASLLWRNQRGVQPYVPWSWYMVVVILQWESLLCV